MMVILFNYNHIAVASQGNLEILENHISLSCTWIFESRDEILIKGGRLWRPRFSISLISSNDRVKTVDSSHTLVNLGHHLENLVNNH
jgi:hypothetical protein